MPKVPPLASTASSPSSPHGSSLRLPAKKRIGTPVSQRLNSITDPESSTTRYTEASATTNDSEAPNADDTGTASPRRRSLASIRLPLPPLFQRRTSGTSSKISHPAPPYDWVPEPIDEKHDGTVPVEGEKLRQLRGEDDEGKTVLWWRRKRALALVVVLVVLIALAIGLGVGLSHQQRERSENAIRAGNRTEAPLQFPLGQWTVDATLTEASTGCTSNPSVWRCYPYTIGGPTKFDLTIANTSTLYAPNDTTNADTGPVGIPANLLISSSNPFAIPFTNQSLTYISSPSNKSVERLEWSFEMTKSVKPSSSMMDSGGTAECAFPGTMFTGILYLNAARTSVSNMGGNDEWRYAVEIRQSAQADGETQCRGMSGGGSMSVPGASGLCDCVYRNY